MTIALTGEFSGDRPLTSKADDKLNRSSFAERVAGVLRGLPKGTGLVVGIHGPWGDGKSTLLNMLRGDLELDGRTVVRDFNPWRLSDEESMLRGFFLMLAEAIGESLSTKFERTKAGAGKWAKRARWVTRPAGWFLKSAGSIDEVLAKFGEIALSGDTVGLDDLRTRIDALLKSATKRIVVMVDDIDRLDKHETHTLFRLIKACADFPNVCYVLAFDDVAVSTSLGDRYGAGDEASGRAFLEKIIQVPLKLPVAMKEDLRSLCFQQIDQALSAAGLELTKEDVGGFVFGFDRGISIRLNTPRAAKRYGNGVMFALPMLKGEVNIVDLLLIEAVRAFYPAIYDIIRANHSEYSGVESQHRQGGHEGPPAVALLKPVLEVLSAGEQEAIMSLLKGLFPRLGSAYGCGGYGTNWLSTWTKAKRLCSPDYCSRYFSYSIPTSDVRDSEMDTLYMKAAKETPASLCKVVSEYFTGGKAKRVIERMRQQEESTPPQAVSSLCVAIAVNAKHIPNPPSLFRFSDPLSQAGILISHLIGRLPAGDARVKLAKQVIESADPLWFGAEVLRWLYVTDDADKADNNILIKVEVQDVSRALVKRIRARAASGEPLFNNEVTQEKSLLYEWMRMEGRDPVQAHLTSVFAKDPMNIVLFLQTMAPQSWGADDVVPRVGRLDGNQLKSIKLLFDLDAFAQLIRQHLPGDFVNPEWYPDSSKPVEQQLAEQFMFIYNKWKKEGEPPEACHGSDNDSDEVRDSAMADEDG
jgi:predicted KAP-like P-loop ATPase